MKWFMTSTGGPIDPNTDPNDIVLSPTGQRVESGLEAGADIAKGVSIFWPPAALIAGLLTSGVAAIKKYKPQLATAETQRDQFYNVTNALVFAIEKLKEDYPEDWESHLEPILKKHIDPNGSIEAVIRAIRGLPVKT
jgi:hypothetical protein